MINEEATSKIITTATAVYTWNKGFITAEPHYIVKPNDYSTGGGCQRVYLEFNIPSFAKKEIVKSAVLHLWQDDGNNGGATRIGVYRSFRTPQKGAFVPFSMQYPLDYSEPTSMQSVVVHKFDITDLFSFKKNMRKIYLEVKMTDEESCDGSFARFISTSNSKFSPQIIFETASIQEKKSDYCSIPEYSVNLLNGHGFDDFIDLSKWKEDFNCDDFEIAPRHAGALFGNAAAMFRSYNDTTIDSGISQSVRLYDEGTYVFSAYLRILGDGIHSDVYSVTPGVYLCVRANGRILAQSEPITQAKEYVRVCISFTARSGEAVVAEIKMNGQGSLLIDGAQLEYNNIHPYNILRNAQFTNGLSEWQYSPNITHTSIAESPCKDFKKGIRLLSAPGEHTFICQSIPIGMSINKKQLYSFSAVARANGIIPNTFHKDSQPAFRICAKIIYSDNSSENNYAEFTSQNEVASYAEIIISPKQNQIAERIEIMCEYSNNFGYADFSNLCLMDKNET